MTNTNYEYIPGEKVGIKAWVKGVQLEDSAKEQLLNIAKMPFIFKHVAVMPDCHWGMGATVGSVIATKGAIIPAAVGVDLGCGMIAQKTTLTASDLPDDLHPLRLAIEAAVPHGRTNDGKPGDRGAWGDVPKVEGSIWNSILLPGWKEIIGKHPKVDTGHVNHVSHLGTLGTGNHFIEVLLDEEQNVWVMLHSGSRGVGNRVGSYFIDLAKQDMKKWMINLPDQDLAYIPEGADYFKDYLSAVEWAQRYAQYNRKLMMEQVLMIMQETIKQFDKAEEVVQCHHNYISREHHFDTNVIVTRKGAVNASKDQLGIIPGSMGVGSFIVKGLGNPDSFNSCSHGAGRAMGRNEAKKRFTVADHIAATQGIECRKDADVIDETPGAYKPLSDVMAAQSDLVEPLHRLQPLLCVKG